MSGAGEINLKDWIFGPRRGEETEIQLQTARAVLRQLLHSSSQGRGIGSLISYLELIESSALPHDTGYTIDKAMFAAILDNAAASRDWIFNLEQALAALSDEPEMRLLTGDELIALLQVVIRESRDAAALRRHTLAVDLGSLEGAVSADAAGIRIVASELLGNALKFSRPASLVRLQAGFHGGHFELRVQNACDTPPEGAAAVENKWLHPFLKVNNQIDDRYSRMKYGFGIGLTICDYKIRQMRGRLAIHSERETAANALPTGRTVTARVLLKTVGS